MFLGLDRINQVLALFNKEISRSFEQDKGSFRIYYYVTHL
jgi:hypothetical protein